MTLNNNAMCCPVWYNTVRNTNWSAFDRVSKEIRGKGAIQIETYYYYYNFLLQLALLNIATPLIYMTFCPFQRDDRNLYGQVGRDQISN